MKPVDCGFRCACTFVHATNVFFSSNGSTGKSAVGRFTYSWCWIMGIGPSSWCGSYLEGLLLSAWRHGSHRVLKRKTGPSTADDVPRGLARVSTSHRRVCAASDDSARESVREPSGMFHPSSQRLAMSTSTVASKHPNGSEPQHHPFGEQTPHAGPRMGVFSPLLGSCFGPPPFRPFRSDSKRLARDLRVPFEVLEETEEVWDDGDRTAGHLGRRRKAAEEGTGGERRHPAPNATRRTVRRRRTRSRGTRTQKTREFRAGEWKNVRRRRGTREKNRSCPRIAR